MAYVASNSFGTERSIQMYCLVKSTRGIHSANVHMCMFLKLCATVQVVRTLKKVLRPHTGTVVVRDYAEGDLAERRLSTHGAQRKLGENFYVRGDGTRCYYFSQVHPPHRPTSIWSHDVSTPVPIASWETGFRRSWF